MNVYTELVLGGIIADDRFIVSGYQTKAWAGEDGPGAVIEIKQVRS